MAKQRLWVLEWDWKEPNRKHKAGWRPLAGYTTKKEAVYEAMLYRTLPCHSIAKFRVAKYTPNTGD